VRPAESVAVDLTKAAEDYRPVFGYGLGLTTIVTVDRRAITLSTGMTFEGQLTMSPVGSKEKAFDAGGIGRTALNEYVEVSGTKLIY
jgi:hypothetical protein